MIKFKNQLLAFLILTLCGELAAYGITVEEAYETIPHKQVTYSSTQSGLLVNEREFLSKLFSLSDRALVARIETLNAFQRKDYSALTQYKSVVEKIKVELLTLNEPVSANGMKLLLVEALSEQEDFFGVWASGKSVDIGTDAHVEKASAKLRQLYSLLMERFKNESAHNRDSFYQHLCALDFK